MIYGGCYERIKKILAAVLVACFAVMPIAGCGASDPNRIDFWVKGSESEVAAYKAMVDEFNASYGASHGIKRRSQSRLRGSTTPR